MSDVRVVAGAVGVALAVGFIAGGEVASRMYEKKAAVAAAQQGAKDYERLKKAVGIQDSLRSELSAARADAERVRRALAGRAVAASGDNALARASACEKLLSQSVDLLSECRERYLGCAGRHDALVEAVK